MKTYSRDEWQKRRHMGEQIKKALGCALAFDGLLFLFLQPFRPVLVVGESMLPTLTNLQVVLARRVDREPNRGEIVVADYDDEAIIKRVAGVPGDTGLPGMGYGSKVPWKHVYLLGDNAKVSQDSRAFGPISDQDVKYFVVFPPQN